MWVGSAGSDPASWSARRAVAQSRSHADQRPPKPWPPTMRRSIRH